MTIYFISRHPGAIAWAERQNIKIDCQLAHLDMALIRAGDTVIGSLPVNLAADLSGLLLWDFYPALIAWHRQSPALPEHQALVGFYEKRMQRTENLLRGLLNKWHCYLLELS